MFIDARIPVRFGSLDSRKAGEALLTDAHGDGPGDGPGDGAGPAVVFEPGPGHAVDCACCLPRSEAAKALAQLFRDRALATGPAFGRVLACVGPAGRAAVEAALAADPVAAGRYRLDLDDGARG